jgi:hypothetical protein
MADFVPQLESKTMRVGSYKETILGRKLDAMKVYRTMTLSYIMNVHLTS